MKESTWKRELIVLLVVLCFADIPAWGQAPNQPIDPAPQTYWQLLLRYDAEGPSLVRAEVLPHLQKRVENPGHSAARLHLPCSVNWLNAEGEVLRSVRVEIPLGHRGIRDLVTNQIYAGELPEQGTVLLRLPGPHEHLVDGLRIEPIAKHGHLVPPQAFRVASGDLPIPSRVSINKDGNALVGWEKVLDSGPDDNRLVIAVLSEGYTEDDIANGAFTGDVQESILQHLETYQPWDDISRAVNVYRLDVVSAEQGIDNDPCGTFVDTHFNSRFVDCGFRMELAGNGNELVYGLADQVVGAGVWDRVVVLINTSTYSAYGGQPLLMTVDNYLARGGVFIHEFGHAFNGLGDEYGGDCSWPWWSTPNISRSSEFDQIPWAYWIEPDTPLPTPNTYPYEGVVGAFLGGHFCDDQYYRPWRQCLMRYVPEDFCPVCKEATIVSLLSSLSYSDSVSPPSDIQHPLDWFGKTFSLDPLDINHLTFAWTLNGHPLTGCDGPDCHIYPWDLLERDSSEGTLRVVVDYASSDVRLDVPAEHHGWQVSVEQGWPASGDHSWVVPGVARLPGAQDTQWRTGLAGVNHNNQPADLELLFLASEFGKSSRSATLTLAAGATIQWQDVLESLFDYSDSAPAKGTMHIDADLPLAITARTYNQADSGTFGQYLPALSSPQSLSAGDIAVLPQLARSADFRTNIGVVNLGSTPGSVQVRLYGEDGTPVANTLESTVLPGRYWQWDNVLASSPGATGSAYASVEVTTAGAMMWAFGSVVDNATGDPTTIPVNINPGPGPYLVPGIAHAPGALATEWRSNLAAVNLADQPAVIELSFIPADGGDPVTGIRHTLPAAASIEWQDVLVELFDYPSDAVIKGTVRVEAAVGLAVSARTYNKTESGTFGQYFPALTAGQALAADRIGIIPQLRRTASFRSNTGILNLGATSCTVELTLFGSDGGQVGDLLTVTVEPGRYWQGDDIFGAGLTGAGDQAIAYAALRTLTPGGLIWAYGSVIDNATGDPTTIPVLEGPASAPDGPGEPSVGSIRPVTTIAQGGYHPRWSPDGQTIAYTTQHAGGEPQLYIVPAAGGQESHIVTGLQGDHALAWLPDGEHISFDAYVPGSGRLAIWKVNLASGEVNRLTSGGNPFFGPTWAGDGSRLGYTNVDSGNGDIWSQLADGGDMRRHTSDPAFDWYPHWSSDGARILFTSDRSGNADIWIVDVATGVLTQVTTDSADDDRAVWSPDGEWIAFNSARGGQDNIWIVSADGGSPLRLTSDADGGAMMPDWSPDGSQLAYVAAGQIWAMTLSTVD